MNFSVIKPNQRLWLIVCAFWLLLSPNALSLSVSAVSKAGRKKLNFSQNTPKKSVCSQQSLEILTTKLLRDLPNYANRASQRSRRLARKTDIFSYVILAGRPEFTPLPLNPGDSSVSSDITSPGVEQVFFTTLERRYIANKILESQEFHWLLLTKTESGWRKVMMFSQTGSSQSSKILTPPRESSNGYIGQAIDTWLRDCRAGS